MGLSKIAYKFLGGVLHSADALAALYIPAVNSYKRVDAAVTTSGATWSPNTISYSGNNRTHMVRIPDDGRFEVRLMDGATNPYLSQAALIASGLDGVNNDRKPGKRLDFNMYEPQNVLKRVRKLPANLLDAIRLFESSNVARTAFGSEFVDSYAKLKHAEWGQYAREISAWERAHTLDC